MRKLDLVFIHQLGAALVDHTGQVGYVNIVALYPEFEQQPKAGQRCSTGARGDKFDALWIFPHDFQGVQYGCAHRYGGAVLVIMKDRDLHAFAQLPLNIKAVRRLDVFEVDGPECGLQ